RRSPWCCRSSRPPEHEGSFSDSLESVQRHSLTLRPMKILVVEYDRKVAGFIEQGLREEGYAVDVAPDGDEATTLAHVYDYDLVVLDVMLPKKNGLQVAAELRREGWGSCVPRASGRGGAAARGTQDPHPDAHRARHHGGRGARARRRRRRLSRQAIQVRRVVGAGARTDPAGRREPHGTPELWTGRAQ